MPGTYQGPTRDRPVNDQGPTRDRPGTYQGPTTELIGIYLIDVSNHKTCLNELQSDTLNNMQDFFK